MNVKSLKVLTILTLSLTITWTKLSRDLRSHFRSKKKVEFLTNDFDVDSYISVKDKKEWYQYLSEFSKAYMEEDSSVWKTQNPIICYLAVRLFPLEYVDEVQKVFARIRFSTNCGNRRDVIFMSPISEDDPYDSRNHPKNIQVSSILIFLTYLI